MHRLLPRLVPLLLLLLALLIPTITTASPPADAPDPQSQLRAATGGNLLVSNSLATGKARFVRATNGRALIAGRTGVAPADQAGAFFQAYGSLFGIRDAQRELKLLSVETDIHGLTTATYQQQYQGVPVFGARLRANLNGTSALTAVNGRFVPDLALDTTPAIAPEDASKAARFAVARGPLGNKLTTSAPELVIFHAGLVQEIVATPRLAYRMVVTNGRNIRKFAFVDAQSGKVLELYEGIHADEEASAPTALRRTTFDMRHSFDYEDAVVCRTEGAGPSSDLDCNLAHDYAGETYNYFFRAFGRDSLDNNGLPLLSYVHAGIGYENASWNGIAMTYGDGFAVDDVVGHELSHGVTEFSANLVYAYQPGALNESFSDVFGETIDLLNNSGRDGAEYRWAVAEDSIIGDFRNMRNPNEFGDPSTTDDPRYLCSPADTGGVHINSGIPNRLYALLVDGGDAEGQTISPIGLIKAGAIHYRALTAYHTEFSDFGDHNNALASSCNDLIGADLRDPRTGAVSGERITAADCQEVVEAAAALKLSAPVCQGFANENPPALCPGNAQPTYFFNDNQDTETNLWGVGTGLQNLIRWEKVDFQTRGKVWRVENTDALCIDLGVSDNSTLTSPPILIPTGATSVTLRFDHYFGTEGAWDGGIVEYSVNDGPFAQLPESRIFVNGYNYVLAGQHLGNTNPIALPDTNRRAFTGFNRPGRFPEPGFLQSRADLSGLVSGGQTVRLRFHFGQDLCTSLDGWYVDTVQVYSCQAATAVTLATVEAESSRPMWGLWAAGLTGMALASAVIVIRRRR